MPKQQKQTDEKEVPEPSGDAARLHDPFSPAQVPAGEEELQEVL
jgi:hypothetical protein